VDLRSDFFPPRYLMSQKIKSQLIRQAAGSRVAKAGVTVIFAAVLPGYANYAGISSDKQMAQPQSCATQQSIAPDRGHWLLAD
jgi:hypothetical protein